MTAVEELAREQLCLRVRRESELDKILRVALDGKFHTDEELAKVNEASSSLTRSGWLLRLVSKWFDNLTVQTLRGHDGRPTKASYVNVMPYAPIPVGTDVRVDIGAIVTGEDYSRNITSSSVMWPQAPPMIESMEDTFKTPAWFGNMEKMVNAGRHIALSGPPGVGKDTAVQELAAQQGKILVTIGGDSGFRRRDLVGAQQISNGQSYFEVAEYAAAVVNGWWALITEVNAADADALLFINAQLAPPYIINIAGKSYPVHPDFRLFISYNPGLVGTKPLPQSFKDRFFSIKVPFWTEAALTKVLEAHGMPSLNEENTDSRYSVLISFAMRMWNAHERGTLRYQITSRRLRDAVELMKDPDCSVADAVKLAVMSAIDSTVEVSTATQILNDTNR